MPMRFMVSGLAGLLLVTTTSISSPARLNADDHSTDDAEFAAEDLEFFESKIRPVLVQHCYECHAADSKILRGGLRVDTRAALLAGGDSGPSLTPGKPDESILLDALRYDGLEMPPAGRLPDSVVRDFETWIKRGAADPRTGTGTTGRPTVDFTTAAEFWAFQAPVRSEPPEVADPRWSQSAIDRFVWQGLQAEGLQPAVPADRRTLLRRLYFDMIGLPPDPTAVNEFLADDSPEAVRRLVDRLLDSPQFGERWARMWLDIARYGEDQAHTFKARRYPRGYLYRDWVVDAFNRDLPYDEFLRHQIAADLLEDDGSRHERLAALGLFALGPVYYQDNGEKEKALADEWDDRVDTLIRGTQSLTIACARCHDHKYDPLTMEDYYALTGVFRSSQYQERPVVPDEVVQRRAQADAATRQAQTNRDQFLAEQARTVRPRLVNQVSAYVAAAWQVTRKEAQGAKRDAAIKDVLKARQDTPGLNSELLKRWTTFLASRAGKYESAWVKGTSGNWSALNDLASQADADELPEAVADYGNALQAYLEASEPQREPLFSHFGDALAFVNEADVVDVPPGQIPLGNLFDDGPETELSSALRTDPFKSTAQVGRLGVVRVASGWGDATSIAEGITFRFGSLGSDERGYGSVTNDGWHTLGGIRTQGKSAPGNLPRTEQGIGIHANGLVTFDIEAIRRAGALAVDKPLRFVVDRAGLNDDTFGNGGSSVHLAVIVSRPHSRENVYDAILSAHVNGREVAIDENDRVYYLPDAPGEPLRANGQFVRFDISLPPEARYLTLVSTGAGNTGDPNTISSDHAVFSGARLEYAAEPPVVAERSATEPASFSDADRELATLLSEMFHDRGVLAIPADAASGWFDDSQKQQLANLDQQLKESQESANEIVVLMAHALADGESADMPLYRAGDPTKKGDPVPRSFPKILTGGERIPFAANGSGRRQLADAIASRDNPLTARVIVNRIWQAYFGYGLVRTPSNFGQLGDRPSHPELLDYLAIELMDSGWSLKHVHRLIVLSQTYQQSSRMNARAFEIDPENRLLWRMNRRRLQVEPWRDALLSVSGTLDLTMGGPSADLSKSDNRRRTLYGFISRHQLDDLLRLFDFPDPNITTGRRSVTTVPLQQLFVLNSEFMNRQARALAARIQQEAEADDDRIQLAFALLYGRPADPDELAIVREFLESESNVDSANGLSPWERCALALLGSNEFSFLD